MEEIKKKKKKIGRYICSNIFQIDFFNFNNFENGLMFLYKYL